MVKRKRNDLEPSSAVGTESLSLVTHPTIEMESIQRMQPAIEI